MADLSLGDIALLVLAAIAVAGVGPFARWVYRRATVLQIILSNMPADDPAVAGNDAAAEPPATTTAQPATSALQSPAIDRNGLLLEGQARALATMVKAGKIGETEGIKIVFGISPSSTNARYLAARAALKAELDRLSSSYPPLTPEQRRAREALGLERS